MNYIVNVGFFDTIDISYERDYSTTARFLFKVDDYGFEWKTAQKFKIDRFFFFCVCCCIISSALCSMWPIQDSDMVQLSNGMEKRAFWHMRQPKWKNKIKTKSNSPLYKCCPICQQGSCDKTKIDSKMSILMSNDKNFDRGFMLTNIEVFCFILIHICVFFFSSFVYKSIFTAMAFHAVRMDFECEIR